MPRSLKKISRFFKRQTEARFNPMLDSSTQCGVILDIDKLFDVDYVTDLQSFGLDLGAPETGTASLPNLADFRQLKLSAQAKVQITDAIPLGVDIGTAVNAARQISMSFGDVNTKFYKYNLLDSEISRVIKGPEGGLLASYLADGDHHVVTKIFTSTINVHFESAGNADTNFEVMVGDMVEVSGDFGWSWANKATLTSAKPVVIGFESARWKRKAKRLVSTS